MLIRNACFASDCDVKLKSSIVDRQTGVFRMQLSADSHSSAESAERILFRESSPDNFKNRTTRLRFKFWVGDVQSDTNTTDTSGTDLNGNQHHCNTGEGWSSSSAIDHLPMTYESPTLDNARLQYIGWLCWPKLE